MRKRITPMRLVSMLLLFAAAVFIHAQAPGKLASDMSWPYKVRTSGTSFAKGHFQQSPTSDRGAQALTTTADGTTLYGDVIYADSWATGGNQYGVRAFDATSPGTIHSEYEDQNFKCNAGAVYRNGEYRILNAYDGGTGVEYISYYVYDTESWEELDENELGNASFMATDLAVDPLTNEIYGAFYDGSNGQQLAVADFDRQTYEVRGKLDTGILAIAFNSEGRLFAIGTSGMLYSVNKKNGELSKIGSTGITPATYLQSATFDLLTDKLYWATTLSNDVAGLYEVDTTTGKASLIANFPDNEQVVGLFCKNKISQDAAPAAPTNLQAAFEGNATTGSITFTLPTKNNVGALLTEPLSYVVSVNDEVASTGNGSPGEQITVPLTIERGNAKILVAATNETGKGTPAILDVWLGNDAPRAVTGLTATYIDGQASLTWNAPKSGLHGGYLDTSSITYQVVRHPDEVTVATNLPDTAYTETLLPEELAPYYYTVTASAGDMEGGTAQSNVFSAGQAITLPYSQTFDDESTFSLLTIIDANEDGTKWEPLADKGYAILQYSNDYGADDWLVTPALKMEARRFYRLKFDALAPWGANYPETIAAYCGKSALPASQTGEIIPPTTISYIDTVKFDKYFTVAESGNYNVGIQCTSYDQYKLQLDNLLVQAGPSFDAPAAVSDFTVEADKQGLPYAQLSFTTPARTASGGELGSVSKVEIYRNGELISTINQPQPNRAYSVQDSGAKEGMNYYTVLAYNEYGAGYVAEKQTYIGEDIPAAPTNVRVTDNGDGTADISWESPAIGANGGYIDSKNLHYGIKNNSNETLETAYKGTTYTAPFDITGNQGYVMYAIFAANSQGYSKSSISNAILSGAPYTLPFFEDFPGREATYFWGAEATDDDSYASWSTRSGYANFEHGTDGDGAHIFSGKIDLGEAANPVLEFKYWYRAEEGNEPLRVQVYRNGTDTVEIGQLEYTLYMNAKDFEQVRLPLNQFKGAHYIQVAFNIEKGTALSRAAIDDVRVRDRFDHDLQASISGPSTASAADTIDITATVRNMGAKSAAGYTVDLYESDKLLESAQGVPLAADSVCEYHFKVPVNTLKEVLSFTAVAHYETDGASSDNTTDTLSVAVSLPAYPAPSDVTGVVEGDKVKLTWSAPEYADFALPTVENAESYAPFIIDSIGDWTVIDGDGLSMRSITGGGNSLTFDHKGEAFAFMVMNPERAGASYTDWRGEESGWRPVSGRQFLASFGSRDGANNDWLISPELLGNGQNISFYAHGYYSDTYEVLYSTTDKDTANFISLGSKSASKEWTKDSYTLPAGAKYFAIRNIPSDYPYYLFIDDITFAAASGRGALALSGYNVYRNGERLNEEPITGRDFTDETPGDGSYVYQVTAIYNTGESVPETCEITVISGINGPSGITGAGIEAIYDLSGRLRNGLRPGINLLKMTDGTTRKVLVK